MTDDDRRELEIALMHAQLEKLNNENRKLELERDRLRQDLRWEPWKALAAFLGAAALFGGAVLAMANWLVQHQIPNH